MILRMSESTESFLSPSTRRPVTVVISRETYPSRNANNGLSVLFTTLCIVDLFGVFPVVALPKSIISCGLYGIPLVICLLALQMYTAVLLGRSWLLAHELSPDISEKNRFPYAALAELAFGHRARKLVIFLIDATVIGAAIPNFIFASQSMQLFWWKMSGGDVCITYCTWMLVIGVLLCPVMWLGSPKEMKLVAIASVGIVTTVAVSVWVCILQDESSPPSPGDVVAYVPSGKDFLVAYSIMAFQFDIHPMLLTLQVDMQDGRKINSALVGGFAYTGLLFTVTSLLAANRYGSNVPNNILQGMAPSNTLYMVALLVTLQLCLSSAVGNSALFQHIEDLFDVPRRFCAQRCILRSSIVALAIFLGESVPRFDVIMGVVGSSLTGPLMFVFPPLFFIRLCYKKTRIKRHQLLRNKIKTGQFLDQEVPGYSILCRLPLLAKRLSLKHDRFSTEAIDVDEYNVRWYDVVLALVVMSMGVGATALATYTSWSDAMSSATFTLPCLLNATEAARSFVINANNETV